MHWCSMQNWAFGRVVSAIGGRRHWSCYASGQVRISSNMKFDHGESWLHRSVLVIPLSAHSDRRFRGHMRTHKMLSSCWPRPFMSQFLVSLIVFFLTFIMSFLSCESGYHCKMFPYNSFFSAHFHTSSSPTFPQLLPRILSGFSDWGRWTVFHRPSKSFPEPWSCVIPFSVHCRAISTQPIIRYSKVLYACIFAPEIWQCFPAAH